MVRFTNRDIVRHPLVETILDAYHQESERGPPPARSRNR
jgi:phosphate starvation-inducible protein PhoH